MAAVSPVQAGPAAPFRPLTARACHAVTVSLWLLVLGVALLIPNYPQPASYHLFADARACLGVPNFANVASNVAFLLVGILGLAFVLGRHGARAMGARGRWPYAVLFLGAVLTAFGSAYYHWDPSDETLVWDRAGMAVAFCALVPAMLSDRTDVRAVLVSLAALVTLGIGTLVYWRLSEALGFEDVAPYLVLQAAALAYAVGISLLPSRFTRRGDVFVAFLLYAAALVAQALDEEIFLLAGSWMSGHTLKHLLAAVAIFWILRMLMRRRLVHR
ncbi:MAG TPA: alkaline phytoceramidase [Pelomicrobium sp.]|nr:alkaline phytoceramidase [Pelomicrobium sp.]